MEQQSELTLRESRIFIFWKWKEIKCKIDSRKKRAKRSGYLIQFPSSFGSRGVAGRGARRQRGLQGVPQPVANSFDDELRFFQMTILR